MTLIWLIFLPFICIWTKTQCESCKCRSYFSPFQVHVKITFITGSHELSRDWIEREFITNQTCILLICTCSDQKHEGATRQHCPLKTSSQEENSNITASMIYVEWQGKRWNGILIMRAPHHHISIHYIHLSKITMDQRRDRSQGSRDVLPWSRITRYPLLTRRILQKDKTWRDDRKAQLFLLTNPISIWKASF